MHCRKQRSITRIRSGRRVGSALFHHRAFHQVIVVGDYLYIDGGEVATWNGVGDGIQGGNNSDVVMLPGM